jgi:hypothetical protein
MAVGYPTSQANQRWFPRGSLRDHDVDVEGRPLVRLIDRPVAQRRCVKHGESEGVRDTKGRGTKERERRGELALAAVA